MDGREEADYSERRSGERRRGGESSRPLTFVFLGKAGIDRKQGGESAPA